MVWGWWCDDGHEAVDWEMSIEKFCVWGGKNAAACLRRMSVCATVCVCVCAVLAFAVDVISS